jgi:hypothetical protein
MYLIIVVGGICRPRLALRLCFVWFWEICFTMDGSGLGLLYSLKNGSP